jgi:ATP-dependent Clp protease ATP-binding subunit ClpA
MARIMQDSYVTEEHLFLALIDRAATLENVFRDVDLNFSMYKKEVENLRH